jgi:ABC-type lipoprotein export system ATPase subunit
LEGFELSLLKATEAEMLLFDVRRLLAGQPVRKKFQFSFEYKIENAVAAHLVEFGFNQDDMLLNNFCCIVGKNGTGKTKVLSQLANKLTDVQEDGDFLPARPGFSKVIAASFSFFDKFKFPQKRKDSSYEFIGIKTIDGTLSDSEMSELVWKAFKELTADRNKLSIWNQAIQSSLETDYLSFNIDQIINSSTRSEFLTKTDDIFSSGQKIVFQFVTRLISVIEENSILLFDEPETHLHPNIAGRLLRTLDYILKQFGSFCILSTHSPIIVQEIPSRFIRVFERQDNFPIIYSPDIECFGENLSIISNAIFNADQETELYKIQLDELLLSYNVAEIKARFDGKLSLNAILYLQTKSASNHD